MNKRERVIAAVEHRETDFVPYHLRFMKQERLSFIEATGVKDPESHFGNHIDIAFSTDFMTEPEIYPVREVKKKYGDDLCFLGGISVQTLLPCASPDAVESGTREIIEIMGAGGGFIAAPTHDITTDTPVENISAMIRALQNQ